MKKKYKPITIILLILIFIIFTYEYRRSFESKELSIEDKTLQDGIYFIQWDAHHVYTDEEKPIIQLPLYQIHNTKGQLPLKDISIELLSNKGCLNIETINIIPGINHENFTTYTILVTLSPLLSGDYIIKQLSIQNSRNENNIYNIGNWHIHIHNKLKEANDIKVGRVTSLTSGFNEYHIELTNISDSTIEIDTLNFNLPNNDYTIKVTSNNNFLTLNNITSNKTLEPGKTKTFHFEFKQYTENNTTEFISLKPTLIYTKKGTVYEYMLPPVIYSRFPNSEMDAYQILIENIDKYK